MRWLMTRKLALAAVAAVAAVTLLGASSSATSPMAAGGGSPGAAAAGKRAKLKVDKTRFGRIIVDGRGLAAYVFTKEKRGGKPRCYGDCAKAWPPLKTRGKPVAKSGVRRKLIGTVKRRKGGRQVTYRGRPLYLYEHDSPGVILCHDVREFGGDWLVVKRSGRPAD